MSAPSTLRSPAAPPGFALHDDGFLNVIGPDARLVLVAQTDAHEGPVYVAAEDALYFTSVPGGKGGSAPTVAIRRVGLTGRHFPAEEPDVTTVVSASNGANGMTLAPDGRLIVCEQGSLVEPATIAAIDPLTGQRQVLVDAWRGRPLNSPNDVAISPRDGSIWFTDPSYGFLQGFRPQPVTGDHVYRLDPATGRADLVASGFDKPNGIAFSPDGQTVYVTDSGANQTPGSYDPRRPHHVVAFRVTAKRVSDRRVFAVTTPGFPDGLKVDETGRVYVSSTSGVLVYDPTGHLLGEIRVAGAVNFTFGGPDRNVLFITADTAIWAAVLNTKGA